MILPTMICGTDHEDACRLPPITTQKLPSRMQFRRPSGKPMMEQRREHTAAANVYADAIIGIT
jgi:hypothetical protein